MNKNRLEAFTDGVLAIIITIMVLEFKVPENADFQSLINLLPIFGIYTISFILIVVHWNNHHHLLQISKSVNSKILWANHHQLFWLSIVPFATAWVGEDYSKDIPMVFYGFILLMKTISYFILEKAIIAHHKNDDCISEILYNKFKNYITLLLYILGIGVSFFFPLIALLIYVIILFIWFIPSKKVENVVSNI
ncbi:TMEM175 family protein [Cyclobacterium sp.]|uniref:TMEM175 family protein n=1 Tax=Cyclobacterium sp. TaxID=1966343 RepID=UPI0019A48D29|nr:TMEM175 family protein [Cyclobacterium sp.]MBD3630320.1 DUF1211 domain-containing protein [Cyclobacterium sp.]